MNKITITLLFIAFFVSPQTGDKQELIDFGKCKFKTVEVKELASFKGEKGDLIKPSRRNAKFVEVKLEITSHAAGEFGLYPAMFSALCKYRRVAMVTPAVALGTKVTDKTTGETKEYWYNEPGVSVIMEVKEGEKFHKYIILELPKDVDDFLLQGPAVIAPIKLSK